MGKKSFFKRFDNYEYEYYTLEDGTIVTVATSTYAKKPVKGIAKSHPEDEYNKDFGKRLAAARCDMKVAEKRLRRASNKYNDALIAWIKADKEKTKAYSYKCDAVEKVMRAKKRLEELLR